MKEQKTLSRRYFVLVAAIVLLVCGISIYRIASGNDPADKDGTASRDSRAEVTADAEITPSTTASREREEPSFTYVSDDGDETLKLVMNKFIARSSEGTNEMLTLFPPATPATLAKRLAEHEAPGGIFPLAIGSDGEMVRITSEISVKMPTEQAAAFARSHGLSIFQLPDYAPEWVVYSATDPFDALDKIESLRRGSNVERADIVLGRKIAMMAMPNDPLIDDQWHLKATGSALPGSDMNVEDAWNYGGTGGVLGRGIKIGIIDDGIQTDHPDFVGNIDTTIDRDFVRGIGGSDPVYDEDSHGTAVGGVAAARGNNGLGVSGVAPEATLVGLRLLSSNPFDDVTELQSAESFTHRNDVIQIKNNSWGYTRPFHKLSGLEQAALRNSSTDGRDGKGTIFTFAAGNSALAQDNANYSELTSSIYSLVVGATDSLNRRAIYSEPGANVVISAPSHGFVDEALGITTTDRTGADGYNVTGGAAGDYMPDFSGTSSSCPAVSGAIALMLEKNPELGWRDVHDILIRTAKKINPGDPGWATNAAGLHFNNDFGAGLIDVAAAVEMAGTWTNLGPQSSVPSTKTGLLLPIPDNSSAGRELFFSLAGSNIITEHVTIRLTIDHSARGDLEIMLISPSGTESRLLEVRNIVNQPGDIEDDFSDYTFSTVQNWGENSSGVWTLRIADRRSTANSDGGNVRAAELTVYGVSAPPVNPPPDVRIASPSEDTVFSPGVGYTVEVDATDVDIDSNPDTVEKVDLYENGVLVATDTQAPYEFPRNPAIGVYTYVAMATDPDGLEGESPAVIVTVKNQTPVISSAMLNAGSQAYSDLPLTVTDVDASDPESDPLIFTYNWEFSTDEENYTDSGVTTASLPANPDNSGKLWRCVITASDGNTASDPIATDAVNLLDRPSGRPVRPGGDYAYQSGLVLKGDTLVINRQAVIHEFSQGPVGGISEWIEFLTLQDGSLSGWSFEDRVGTTMKFADDAWDDIPAGTLIVIYNGSQPKDPLLSADSSDPSDGSMVVSSTDMDLFTESSKWPTLDNLGDSIHLKNSVGEAVHEISYGNTLFPLPNVGRVASGEAAYFAGQSDAGANLSNEWLTTTGGNARTSSFSAAAPLAIFPGAIFTNGQYRQDFDTTPGPAGTFFPTGWSAYSVVIPTTQTTNYDDLLLPEDLSGSGGVFNFGSRVGILGGFSRLDPGFIALALDNTRNLTGLQISYDIIKIIEQQRTMMVTLEYTTGNPDNTGTPWTTIAGTTHLTGNSPRNTLTRLNNVPLPAIFENRESPIYLRWYYRTDPNSGNTGTRDAIAIDNLVISSNSSPNRFMTLSLNPSVIAEPDGENASVGTVTIDEPLSVPLTVGISSSDTTEVVVPASALIPAGEISATFPIAAFDDIFADGTQTPTITVSAPGFLNVSRTITVLDNEPTQIGVTSAIPNNSSNADFIDRLRDGRLFEPATYRLADGSVLPEGLSLDPSTGLIMGTISPSATLGSYSVVIEKRNVVGGFTSQALVIVVSDTVTASYSQWIGGFGVSDDSVNGDSDFDFLPNLVEYALGSHPGNFDHPSPIVTNHDESSIWITYTKSKDVIDMTLIAEWSPTMEEGSWETEGIVDEVIFDGVDSQTIQSKITIDPAHPAKFMRLRASLPPPPE